MKLFEYILGCLARPLIYSFVESGLFFKFDIKKIDCMDTNLILPLLALPYSIRFLSVFIKCMSLLFRIY